MRLILRVLNLISSSQNERLGCEVFLIACVAAIAIAAIGAVTLDFFQEPVAVAFATESVRV